ncbi:c-type cytochrome [Sphingobacterium sp. lm-10]|uniref:c-type cytochrome n=1 Tax=Sphingobacterium sp. lm-10 TaxID=2944904 RepID=UPI00202224BD|nr:c-type cytochrome [Sphingobacterium sp. lm-10]MCL7989102.1 c-type cytochrome [Sphingobacterium sp. lm-10]
MQYVTNGEKVYRTHCQNCHGAQGEGLGKLYPPLTDPNYLHDNRASLPRIIRFGLKDSITVSGHTYSENMPAIPELTEVDIAYVLSYVTVRFGNAKSKYEVEEVQKSLKPATEKK